MNTTSRRRALIAGVVALSLTAAACGSDTDSSAETTAASSGASETTASATDTTVGAETTAAASDGASETVDVADLQGTLNASGATFPQAFYEEAIAALNEEAPDLTINYGGGGSGKGRQDLADQIVDWAGSDGTIPDADKANFKGGDVLYFPTVLAPITVSYNLDVDGLQLSPTLIAKIFQRQITTWNDPAIVAENPDADLPDTAITVVHRADGSGTTSNFTKFLDAAVGAGGDGTWTLKSGSEVEWPADTQAGQGNSGVAQIIKDTDGAIGYVDLSDAVATELTFAKIQNKAGKYVEPTLEATSAAAEGIEIKPDLTFFVGWADGDEAYPIAAQTWILVYAEQSDQEKVDLLKGWIGYVLTAGQELAPEVDYAPLPTELRDQALAQLDQITVG